MTGNGGYFKILSLMVFLHKAIHTAHRWLPTIRIWQKALTVFLVLWYIFLSLEVYTYTQQRAEFRKTLHPIKSQMMEDFSIEPRNFDLGTVERIDIWSTYHPREADYLSRDPCLGFEATFDQCVQEFEHIEAQRVFTADSPLSHRFGGG